jgi:hypothetical protein
MGSESMTRRCEPRQSRRRPLAALLYAVSCAVAAGGGLNGFLRSGASHDHGLLGRKR